MKNKMESLLSKDGTTICYQNLGQGPGLIVVSGANTASQDYLSLASHLADNYSVYVVERRGRNGSGPQGDDYCMQKECEDVISLLEKTKSSFLFGHSYGGLIALNVACQYPLAKIAVYEPAVSINSSIPMSWLPRFERFIAKKDYLGALVTLIKGLQLGGKFNFLPSPVFKLMAKSFVQEAEWEAMMKLLPTVPKEAREGIKLDSKCDQYAGITAETLLMGGSKSPAYFFKAFRMLESLLPHSETLIFPGLDHSGPNEHAPEIANALKDFFR